MPSTSREFYEQEAHKELKKFLDADDEISELLIKNEEAEKNVGFWKKNLAWFIVISFASWFFMGLAIFAIRTHILDGPTTSPIGAAGRIVFFVLVSLLMAGVITSLGREIVMDHVEKVEEEAFDRSLEIMGRHKEAKQALKEAHRLFDLGRKYK